MLLIFTLKKINYFRQATFICVLLGVGYLSHAQLSNSSYHSIQGTPFTQVFTPEDYGAHRQNWCFLQSENGLLYVGNNAGLLTYDGVKWRLHSSPKGSIIRSLAMDRQGRVYYGAQNDFGYLSSDSQGVLQFISLSERLPAETNDYKDVWKIICKDEKVYFQTYHSIFVLETASLNHLQSVEIQIIPSSERILSFSSIAKKLYLHQEDVSLKQLKENKIVPTPEGDFFADVSVREILPFFSDGRADSLLICSFNKGLYIWAGRRFSPFQEDDQGRALLTGLRITYANYLSDGSLALATAGQGIIRLDKKGKILQVINNSSGLPSNNVLALYSDDQDGLWAAGNRGLARVETPMSFSTFSTQFGLDNLIYAIEEHQGELYVGTDVGLLVAPKTNGRPFIKVEGINRAAFSLASVKDALLVAFPYAGLYEFKEKKWTRILDNVPVVLQVSKYNEDVVFVGGGAGYLSFSILYRTPQGWRQRLTKPIVKEEIRHIAEEAPGVIWLGSRKDGFIRVEIPDLQSDFTRSHASSPPLDSLEIALEHYEVENSKSIFRARSYSIHDQVYLAGSQGLKSVDRASGRLLINRNFGDLLADTLSVINHLLADQNGEIWIDAQIVGHSFNRVQKLIPVGDKTYQLSEKPLFNRIRKSVVTTLFSAGDRSEILWIGTTKGIIKYDPAIKKNYAADYTASIRSVLANSDSLIYDGYRLNLDQTASAPELPFQYNALRFEYAAASFEASDQNEFQTYLQGFDKGWSTWTSETKKDYTNLPEGVYVFRARAKNIYGVLSKEAAFSFRIIPPWYRSWPAIFAYILILSASFVLSIWGYGKWRTRRLESRTRELEQIIADRTAELAERNSELKQLNATQAHFFANISHEFRTPLTIIMGMIDQIEKKPRLWLNDGVKMIRKNSSNLLDLINQILELRKLDSGKLKVNLQHGDIVPFLRSIFNQFQAFAQSNEQQMEFISETETLLMDYDPEKLLRIVSNLLSNAVKYTPPKGKITFSISSGTKKEIRPRQCLILTVSDNGRGIPKNQAPYIFDRFYQVSPEGKESVSGTGVGLSLTQELVALLNGKIEASSEEGKGSVFQVWLPITKAASPGQSTDILEIQNAILGTKSALVIKQAETEDLPIALIVEDNPDIAQYLQICLEGHYKLEIATNGQEGVDRALELVPDIIVSDVMMPKKDGFELCEMLKEDVRTSHIPIILLTAKSDVDSRIEGLKQGADDYLAKPFHEEELLVRMQNLLDIRRKLQERYQNVYAQLLPKAKESAPSPEDAFILKVKETLDERMIDPQFDLDRLSREFHLSRSQFGRKLKALTGRSPAVYIRSLRLQKAKHLLLTSTLSVKEVAYEVGFSDPAYFSRSYSKEFGETPSNTGDL